jgi:flavin-binding protein dodecin
MPTVMVVANKTLAGTELVALLRNQLADEPATKFVVVVPVARPLPVDAGGAMGGIAVMDPGMQDYLEADAQQRLHLLLGFLREIGGEATGHVVSGDPVTAMERVAATEPPDSIVLSTLPARFSQWLRMDVAHRAARRFDVPLTTIVGTADDNALPVADQPSGPGERNTMGESVYKIIELVGTSTQSWEAAAAAAVTRASQTLRDLRVAEVAQLDLVIDNGSVTAYRAKVKVSFKYEDGD